MTRVRGTDWYTAMDWQSRVNKNTIMEWAISAPATYKAPIIEHGEGIEVLGLIIMKSSSKGKRSTYWVSLDHGLFAGSEPDVGSAKDLDTAKILAIGFMHKYDTWAKVLNWIRRVHKINLRIKRSF
ncbi:hypothetical protein LCGC14_1173970 [marine sediment metagenome]|uniref:Uncharacterized protein n=1 Tax=marine sediment metagenome TaxID=412755 RepID=A0A0F9MC13_9ZZZZ